jgi:hypothetical protein
MTPVSFAAAPQWRRHARHALLLPVALLFVMLEGVVWRGAHAVLRPLAHMAALETIRLALSRLSGWAALPMFLVPEAVARAGELWTAVLLVHGHVVSAALVYVLVRVVATVVAVFIWQACAESLMRLGWLARMVGWLSVARRWALGQTAPLRAVTRRAARVVVRRGLALGQWTAGRL